MITSKKDYIYYYQTDLKRTDIFKNKNNVFKRIQDRRFKFYKSLRKTEYYTNCKTSVAGKIIAKALRFKHSKLCDRYGWTIPINVFGPGLAIVHVGTIVVSGHAKIGNNCRIHVCVNIGSAKTKEGSGAPVLGDNIYIGPGAKIFGPVVIGDNTAIGANAVVNSSFIDGNCSIGGIPAKKISENTSKEYIL